jgi:hypothetical protein
MESEEIISQEVDLAETAEQAQESTEEPTNIESAPAEPEAAADEMQATEPEVAVEKSESAAEANVEAEAAAASEVEVAESEAEAPEATTDAEPAKGTEEVLVATDDVSPAHSRMEIARLAKEALVQKARELADSTDWRKTSEAQRELMEQWRKAGYAGKVVNDKLWEDFREARQAFFARREAEVVEIKKQIIADAKEATEKVSNWVATSTKLDELMARWKEAGNSGSESDKVLWDEFNSIRREFRNRRKADLDKRRSTAQANAKAKGEIVAEAKAIAESQEYTREHSDRMRQLDKDYKAIGFAGKPANDTLWAEFSAAKNAYWAGNNELLDQRRKQRSERLQEVVERKHDQIEHLKTQNETLTTRLGSTLNPDKIAQIKRWIAENEERVDDLQDDVEEIKSKI